jgi:DNA invertase Pin-like site-specific DNA recombinase
MDRLARSVKELTTFIDDFQKRDVNLVFIDQDLDTSKPTGKLIFHLFAAFAEFERDIIRERTLAGLESARARGRKGGRKKAISPEKTATAFKMYDSQNYTVKEICESLGIKVRTFYDYLKKRNQ